VIAYIYPGVAVPLGRCCAAGRLRTLRGRGGWFLQADGVVHPRQEIQRATASTTKVHRPPDPDRRAVLIGLSLGGQLRVEVKRRADVVASIALLTPPEPTTLPIRPAHREVIDTTQALTA
jgi:hypothetical protein